jgi:hypothetical protein
MTLYRRVSLSGTHNLCTEVINTAFFFVLIMRAFLFFQQTGVPGEFALTNEHYTTKVSTYLEINDVIYFVCSSKVNLVIVTFRDVVSNIPYNHVVVGGPVMFPGSILCPD